MHKTGNGDERKYEEVAEEEEEKGYITQDQSSKEYHIGKILKILQKYSIFGIGLNNRLWHSHAYWGVETFKTNQESVWNLPVMY